MTTEPNYGWACVDCLVASHDPEFTHPAGLDYADIALTDWDYCPDHDDDCYNCGGYANADVQAHFDADDGFMPFGGPGCDMCGELQYGEMYRYIA